MIRFREKKRLTYGGLFHGCSVQGIPQYSRDDLAHKTTAKGELQSGDMSTFFTAMSRTPHVSPFGPSMLKANHNHFLMRLLSSC